MRNKEKEDELRESNDPRHGHLNRPLFVEISTVATPAEAYARIAYALTEIRKYIVPDKNDEISQEQYQEAMEIDPSLVKEEYLNKRNGGGGGNSKLTEIVDNIKNDTSAQTKGEFFNKIAITQHKKKKT